MQNQPSSQCGNGQPDSVETDSRHRRGHGPRAEPPSGGPQPQLVQTPGGWPSRRDPDPKHTGLYPKYPICTYLSGGNRESCTTELGEMPKG